MIKLVPNNNDATDYELRQNIWLDILQDVGSILGYTVLGDGTIYCNEREGIRPDQQKGFKVSEEEAKIIGEILIFYTDLARQNPTQRKIKEVPVLDIYMLENAGKWMIKSKGFRIL